jgi:uncharacterized small protein (DUF1192 family)
MRVKRNIGKTIDELLKETFIDDLPPDVAVGMRARIERFRAVKKKSAATSAAWALILRRSAWAVLSILVLAAGILLQGAKSSSPLSDRISALKAEFSSVSTTRR